MPAMRIMSNISALFAVNAAKGLEQSSARAMRRLAEGLRITSSADDAAGLAISEKLRAQVRGLDQAVRNAQDGVSLLQTAEGGLNETHALLQRMRQLSVQAANDTLTLQDRTYLQQEIDQLKEQITLISSTTQFNRKQLLSGNASVLWSTDSPHIRVFVDGSLRSRDAFGQNVVGEGNFRLSITPTAGEGEVQKTNIFYLKHGTVSENVQFSPESGAFSGLGNLRSLHLIDGDYRLETREVPFGGISYHEADGTETTTPAADLGVLSLEASALPDILPYGEYQVRIADEVPFMAYFGGESGGVSGTDVIDRVDPMGRSGVDLSMSASTSGGAVNSQTRLAWTDIGGAGGGTVNIGAGGGDVDFQTDPNFGTNLWTHFRVNSVDRRDVLSSDVNLVTSYYSEAVSTANLEFTYQAAAAENVTLQTTFRTAAGSSFSITRDGITHSLDVSNLDMQAAAATINTALTGWGWGSASAVDEGGGLWRIDLVNGSGDDLDIAGAGGAADLGLAGVIADGGTATGTARDFQREHTVDVGGLDIVSAAAALDGDLAAYNIDFAASDLGGGRRRLQINNNSSGAGGISGSYMVQVLADGGAESFEQELGIGGTMLLAGSSASSHRVLHEYTTSFSVGSRDINNVQAALQAAANSAFGQDDLADPSGPVFELVTGGGTGQINLRTSTVTSMYRISLSEGAGSTITELFGGNQTLDRSSGDVSGLSRDYGRAYATLSAGRNIEELRADLDGLDILDADWTDAASTPGYDGTHHNGRLRITNTDGSPERRRVQFLPSTGTSQLMSGPVSITAGAAANSTTWQARDRASVTTTYTGIDRNGNAVNGSRSDVWWEGDAGTSNPLTGIGALPFTSVFIPDSTTGMDLAAGDSWALFTSAASAGAHDRLDFRIRDGATGSTYDSASLGSPNSGTNTYGGGSMIFNNGVLDGAGGTFALPHLFRTGVGTFGSDVSRVSFIQNGLDGVNTFTDILRTSERYGAAGAGWDTAGQANDRWYAQTWYGEETSYYLAGKDPGTVLPPGAIEVWRQEDVNASILFTVTGQNLYNVRAKGYTRDGTSVEFEENIDLNGHGTVSAANPLILNAGGGAAEIRFDAFSPLELETDDRFVVNIAARAGGTYENSNPGVSGAFLSDSIVTIDANPWGLGGSPSRTMEYRFDAGVEDGMAMRLLGFFVDPGNSNITTNAATGELLLNVAGGGFAAGTRAGEGAGWMPYITAEVNYQGRTSPEAGALVNSFFFQDMESGEGERDFLERIEYAPDETRNAMLLFDVLEVMNGSARFRIQGHIMDRDGGYRYVESEVYGLNESNTDVILRFSPDFDGLRFNFFDFTDISRLREGDRFTLSLVADGRSDMDPVTNRYAVDEINLFGGNTDSGLYPMSWRFDEGVLDNRQTVLHTYQTGPSPFSYGMNSVPGGKVYDGTVSLSFGDFHGGTPTGIPGTDDTPRVVRDAAVFSSVYREGIDGGVAHRYSRLEDMEQFWDANGKFLLDEPATILIRQGNREAGLTLYGNDEIHTVLDRLNNLIYSELGYGTMKHLMSSSDKNKFATFTGPLAGMNRIDAVEGTMILRSALSGAGGAYKFHGDERILNALGMTVINEAKETMFTVAVTDAHSGRTVAHGLKVEGGKELGGIWGDAIRLGFDSFLGVLGIRYSRESGRFITGMSSQVFRTVHLADNSTVLQIGANQGEDLLLSLGAMDAETLGVADLRVTDRDSAGRAMTILDRAIDRVSRQRARIGALTNRLGHAASALAVASENLTAADSRLRDLDFGKEMMNYVRISILTQANMAMMTQANQAPRNVLNLLGQ